MVKTRRSAKQFARGHRGGILTTSMPASARTASNDTANCPARSRTRNRSKFTAVFDAVFTGADIRILRTPIRAPRANAIAERFIGTQRRECLDHLLITGSRNLDVVLPEYLQHFNAHRPNRSLDQRPPAGGTRHVPAQPSGRYDETGSAASSTNTCRSHEVTGLSAPTGLDREAVAQGAQDHPRGGAGARTRRQREADAAPARC